MESSTPLPGDPAVSVIIPLYNGARYVIETLESVAAQELPPLEILVVDDGSTDAGPELVRAWIANAGVPARLISLPHRGAAHARNAGLREARGTFVALLDSDDRWTEDALLRHAEACLAEPDIDGTWGRMRLFVDTGLERPSWVRADLMDVDLPGSVLTSLVLRRSVFLSLGGFEEEHSYSDDLAFFSRLRDSDFSVRQLPHLTAWKRVHDRNLSSRAQEMQADTLRVLREKIHRARGRQTDTTAPTAPEPRKPLVSVIIPAHDAEKYLAAALESVFAQTYSHWELVVYNDQSTDGTQEIIEDWSVRFPERVRGLRGRDRGGSSVARNAAIEHARGEWLALLDADDLWLPEKLSLQMELAEQSTEQGTAWVSGLTECFWSEDVPPDQRTGIRVAPPLASGASAALFQRGLFTLVGPFDPDAHSAEWISWSMRAHDLGFHYQTVDQVLARRRLHLSNKSRQDTSDRLLQIKASLARRRAAQASRSADS